MKVPFTQFMQPDGRQKEVATEVDDGLAHAVANIHGRGWRLTAEMLSTGEISLCVEDPEEGDVAIEVVPNGPQVTVAVERLLLAGDRAARGAK